jgi:hypothetical protein
VEGWHSSLIVSGGGGGGNCHSFSSRGEDSIFVIKRGCNSHILIKRGGEFHSFSSRGEYSIFIIKRGCSCHSFLSRGEETEIHYYEEGRRLASILIERGGLNLYYQEGMQLPFILIKGGGDCHSLLSRGEETAFYSHKERGRRLPLSREKGTTIHYNQRGGDCHSYSLRNKMTAIHIRE